MSGSGSGLKSNHFQFCDMGCEYTRMVNLGTIQWKSANLFELGGLSVGRTVGPSGDSNNPSVFAV